MNILFSDTSDLNSLKIVDFGVSEIYNDELQYQNSKGYAGTLLFMAPE